MAFGVLVNGDEVDLQPQTSIVLEDNTGFLRGYVISENEDRDISIDNISGLDLSNAVTNFGVVVFNSDRDVASSSIFNFVSLLSVSNINLLNVFDSGSQTFSIPSHTYKPVVAMASELYSFFVDTSVVSTGGSNYASNSNARYSGGFSIEKTDPFNENQFVISYSGSTNAALRNYIKDIGTTSVIIGELPNDITDLNGNSSPVLKDTSINRALQQSAIGSLSFELISGSGVFTWSVSPTLPNGLSINTSTGVISGVPTSTQNSTPYTVTVSNAVGSDSLTLNLTISEAPEFLNTPNELTSVSQNNSSTTVSDYVVPAGVTNLTTGVYATDDIYTTNGNTSTINAGAYNLSNADDLRVYGGADLTINLPGGYLRVGDNAVISGDSKLTVNAANSYIRFGDNLIVYNSAEVVIYNSSSNIRVAGNISVNDTSKTLIQAKDSYILVSDNINAYDDSEVRLISESSNITVSDDVLLYQNSVLNMKANTNVTINDRTYLYNNSSLTITSDNGNITLKDVLYMADGSSVSMYAPNGTITIAGVNHGTSYLA